MFMVFKFLESTKLSPKILLSHPRQKEITDSPRQHFYKNLFAPTAERDGVNYDLPHQNSIRKYEVDLKY